MTRGEARSQAQTAGALGRLPAMADRFARGQLGVGQAAVAARALADLPVTGDEKTAREAVDGLDRLVAANGCTQDRRELGRTVEEWADRRGGDGLAERERRADQRRQLWAGRSSSGEALIEGRLTPMVFAKLGAVLDPLSRRTGDDDDRSIGQRRHDALETVLDRAAAVTDHHPGPGPQPDAHADPDRPSGAAPRPDADPRPGTDPPRDGSGSESGRGQPAGDGGRAQVLLITTPEALHETVGAAASELDGWGPVSSETARQICCNADITTVIVGPDGNPLDVGRTRRDPTRRQRLAVIARDRRCVGCGAPARRCQIHHVRWWSDGGPTDIGNLCVLCPACHTNVHHFGWTVRRAGAGYRAGPPPDRLRHTG